MMSPINPYGAVLSATGREPGSLFDAWLQTTLQRAFDKTLSETLPDELIALLPDRPEIRTNH